MKVFRRSNRVARKFEIHQALDKDLTNVAIHETVAKSRKEALSDVQSIGGFTDASKHKWRVVEVH